VVSTLTEIGLLLVETKTLLARLQASMLCGQVAEYAAHHLVCAACGMLQPLKDRRTRRLQTLFGTVEVEAPRGSVKNLGHYAASWSAWWPKRPSSTAALT